MKFKVGDKVKVTKPYSGVVYFKGVVGKVDSLWILGGYPYLVKFIRPRSVMVGGDRWTHMYFRAQELTKVK